ncbi:MAG: flagellar hook-associated protein FlgK [Clostridiales bacterium]|jgi:flagellar hook-associated protein 1 FlgK|nr:flagellar hook-associated protein FlgK [Clostridiales bacterium]
MPSSFSAYYVAKSGIQAARANLQVTGQNISNVNTDGYTRQRVDTYAVGSSGNNMRYSNRTELAIGEGVDTAGLSQLRDPYLDVRYRMEHAKTGMTDTELSALNDLQTVFDEVNKDGINTQLTDLTNQLQTLADSPGDQSLENIVKNSSLLLTKAFHAASEQISQIREQQTTSFQENAVGKVNSLLQNIANINSEIKSADIAQTPALELKDQRNQMLDELSGYLNIQLSSKSVPIGAGRTVEELNVGLVTENGTVNLVSNDQYNQFSLETDASGNIQQKPVVLQLKDQGGNPISISNDDFTTGVFGGYLAMLNDSGEFDSTVSERGIGYYEKSLDKLAYEFANTMNTANSTNTAGDNKPLFSKSNAADPTITAANICISDQWNNAEGSFITATKQDAVPGVDTSKLGDNILSMINDFTEETTFTTDLNNDPSQTTLFASSINSFMSNLSTGLGLQIKTTQSSSDTYNSNLTDIDTQRASISSVDVNEEGINLIMYNQSLTAASRFMTTMDEALDTIINKMGIVGR